MTDNCRWSREQVMEYIAGRVFSSADRYMLERLEENSPETVVEIGCGPGVISGKAHSVPEYICTDITFEFLKAASEAVPSGVFINCAAEVLPFSDTVADCVLAMAVLHHLDKNALRPALREIHRILKPGGRFLLLEDWCFARGITEFEEEARKWRFRKGSGENHLSADKWRRELAYAGFHSGDPIWVDRPFSSSAAHLLQWPEERRTVRMMALESVRQQ